MFVCITLWHVWVGIRCGKDGSLACPESPLSNINYSNIWTEAEARNKGEVDFRFRSYFVRNQCVLASGKIGHASSKYSIGTYT